MKNSNHVEYLQYVHERFNLETCTMAVREGEDGKLHLGSLEECPVDGPWVRVNINSYTLKQLCLTCGEKDFPLMVEKENQRILTISNEALTEIVTKREQLKETAQKLLTEGRFDQKLRFFYDPAAYAGKELFVRTETNILRNLNWDLFTEDIDEELNTLRADLLNNHREELLKLYKQKLLIRNQVKFNSETFPAFKAMEDALKDGLDELEKDPQEFLVGVYDGEILVLEFSERNYSANLLPSFSALVYYLYNDQYPHETRDEYKIIKVPAIIAEYLRIQYASEGGRDLEYVKCGNYNAEIVEITESLWRKTQSDDPDGLKNSYEAALALI